MGWLLDHKATRERVHDMNNAADLAKQPFYTFVQKTYAWHALGSLALLYAVGGLPALIWGGAMRLVWVYNITWFVN